MNVNIHTIRTRVDITICMNIEDIKQQRKTQNFNCSRHKIRGWLNTWDEVECAVERYWPTRHELVMISRCCHERQISIYTLYFAEADSRAVS